MKQFLILISILIFSTSINAAGFSSKKETRKYADKLMDYFVKKQFSAGLNDAKKYWPLPVVEIDGLANKINQQWPIVDKRFGKAISKEFIKSKSIGNSFVRYYYLHKFEKHSIYWRFDFYKPRNEWKINTLIFLDNLDSLYE